MQRHEFAALRIVPVPVHLKTSRGLKDQLQYYAERDQRSLNSLLNLVLQWYCYSRSRQELEVAEKGESRIKIWKGIEEQESEEVLRRAENGVRETSS